jgi:dynein heavy chain
VEDLSVASPATVSRVGIIYVEPSTSVGTKAMVASWLQTLPPAVAPFKAQFQDLFLCFLDEALDFHKRNLREYVATVEPNLWRSVLDVVSGYLKEYVLREGETISKERTDALKKNVEAIFVMGLCWGVAGSCDAPSRTKFDAWIKERQNLPSKGTIFDFSYDVMECKWKGWMETVPHVHIDAKKPFSDLVVSTPDSISYSFMIEHMCTQLRHVLCVGPTGTGKTLTVKQKLMTGLDASVYQPLFLTFSAQTSANQTQDILDGKMDKRRKGVYGPPAGKRFTIFVDDMNMPKREVYFAQPPIEILRQWMDHQGWYDRKIHQFNTIIDVMFVGAMGPPGGGRQPVTNRFLRHFKHIAFPEMSDASMKMIFSKIFDAHLTAFYPPTVKAAVLDPVCDATIAVYRRCLEELLPTPSKSHYTFNLRDLAKVFQGVMIADPKRVGEDTNVVFRLWAHENTRIYRDRLTDKPDRDWFDVLMKDMVLRHFKKNWDVLVVTDRIIFGDYMVPGADPKLYIEVLDQKQLRKVIEGYLDEYNAQTNKPMRLVMFLDAIDHVSRISRILRQPKGNALLLGVGGSGRQSLTRVAAYAAEMHCSQIEIAKGYGKNEWREDLKKILLRSGKEGKPTVFLFTDSQVAPNSPRCVWSGGDIRLRVFGARFALRPRVLHTPALLVINAAAVDGMDLGVGLGGGTDCSRVLPGGHQQHPQRRRGAEHLGHGDRRPHPPPHRARALSRLIETRILESHQSASTYAVPTNPWRFCLRSLAGG